MLYLDRGSIYNFGTAVLAVNPNLESLSEIIDFRAQLCVSVAKTQKLAEAQQAPVQDTWLLSVLVQLESTLLISGRADGWRILLMCFAVQLEPQHMTVFRIGNTYVKLLLISFELPHVEACLVVHCSPDCLCGTLSSRWSSPDSGTAGKKSSIFPVCGDWESRWQVKEGKSRWEHKPPVGLSFTRSSPSPPFLFLSL